MKRDTHNQEQVYVCGGWPGLSCGQLHQESTVAIRETTVDGRVERTLYCDQCGSEALRLCDEAMAVEAGRLRGEE